MGGFLGCTQSDINDEIMNTLGVSVWCNRNPIEFRLIKSTFLEKIQERSYQHTYKYMERIYDECMNVGL